MDRLRPSSLFLLWLPETEPPGSVVAYSDGVTGVDEPGVSRSKSAMILSMSKFRSALGAGGV